MKLHYLQPLCDRRHHVGVIHNLHKPSNGLHQLSLYHIQISLALVLGSRKTSGNHQIGGVGNETCVVRKMNCACSHQASSPFLTVLSNKYTQPVLASQSKAIL